jgi:hypothetical protein
MNARLVTSVGGGAFVLASLVVGVRLLRLAARTRELPELAIGLSLLLMGGLGYPLTMVARLAKRLPDETRIALMAASIALMLVGALAIVLFSWRVFRPGSAWARRAMIGFALLLVACIAGQALGPGLRPVALHNEGLGYRIFMLALGGGMGWAAAESLAWAARLRRRVRLGLADPVVANRMGLWGAGMTASTLISVISQTMGFLGIDFAGSLVGAAVTAPLGLVAAICMALAFVPPDAYLRRVRERNARLA